ncbi:carbamoyltransferase HypF [bacterium]|nr:carbamoyltransferase HypF [bacterium]
MGGVRIRIEGRVQGVGFRPTVYRCAVALGLSGAVRNVAGGVEIDLAGDAATARRFLSELERHLPPLAQLRRVNLSSLRQPPPAGFRIEASAGMGERIGEICPDVALCPDCRRELADPADRRHGYPFINCTNCGPRFTIVRGLPYDRERTTMAGFPMCETCRAEYTDPANRRYHAEPIACPACGPALFLLDRSGYVPCDDPLEAARERLRAGESVLVKGLGGYHLACDATNSRAVERLRAKKRRPHKPFAVMFAREALADYVEVDAAALALLASPEAPIVLLPRRVPCDRPLLAASIAPDNAWIGAFLPYTPLHELLMQDFPALVMTSANFTDEPLVSREDELAPMLESVADVALAHNRPIEHKCDDSVLRPVGALTIPVRRARGWVPRPIPLPLPEIADGVLAVGGELKSTFGLLCGGSALLSQHLGDLDDLRSLENWDKELADFSRLFEFTPERVVCDLHPDYLSTRRAETMGLPLLRVQHHYAHLASCLADNAERGPAVGVIFDGTGYGTDGTLWGGEFLYGDLREWRREGWLAPVPLPGGEQAIREPWRIAWAMLARLDGPLARAARDELTQRVGETRAGTVAHMLERGFNCPLSSGVGRLLDGLACLLGLGDAISHEAQLPVALEGLYEPGDGTHYASHIQETPHGWVLDPLPWLEGVLEDRAHGVAPGEISGRLHRALIAASAELAARVAAARGCDTVALSGGALVNAVLLLGLVEALSVRGLRVLVHRQVPPNDGGIALGQLAIGAHAEK